MKIETRSIYVAFDGAEFPTEHACLAHEREHAGGRLVGLSSEQIAAALTGADRDLAQAIEDAAHRIRKGRYERGELKRQRRSAPAGEAPVVPVQGPADAQAEGAAA